jgi:LemA protein
MTGTLIGIVVVLAFVVIVFLSVMSMYNALVRKRVAAESGWAQIDVQLKRRYDLIPNLVETVKGYAGHERETLESVIAARTRASGITSDAAHAGEKAQAEGFLTQALGRIFALSEAYPDLKANTNFMKLQEELASTENRIGFARQHYNNTVASYEQTRQSFPTNMIAGTFNFQKLEYFELDNPAQREAPKVSFT